MRRILLSVLSGLLLAFSWPETGVFPLIFIAFILLLILEKDISEKGEKTSWNGAALISFGVIVLIAGPFAKLAAYGAIIYGAYCIWEKGDD